LRSNISDVGQSFASYPPAGSDALGG
jgi:hypothetical protein